MTDAMTKAVMLPEFVEALNKNNPNYEMSSPLNRQLFIRESKKKKAQCDIIRGRIPKNRTSPGASGPGT